VILLPLLSLVSATAITYMVAGTGAAAALAAGMALESTNLNLTDWIGRYLMNPARGRAGWFQLFYLLKYGLVITAFVLLVVRLHLGVLPLAAGFTLALVLHIGLHLTGRRPQPEEQPHAV
jgi:uncharacterized membrane protein